VPQPVLLRVDRAAAPRARALREAVEALRRVNGLEVKVAPVSPLAMAQNMEEINNILQFAQIAQGAGPEGQMTLKVGPMLDVIAEKLGVPAAVRNSPEERALMAKEVAQQAQGMAQSQNPIDQKLLEAFVNA